MTHPQVTDRLTGLGDRLHEDLADLTKVMCEEMATRIVELPSDRALYDLLTVSVRSNLETIAQVLRRVVDVETIATPVGASEYARRLAQHGVPANALLRAYRLGQRMLIEWGYRLIDAGEPDRELALEAYHGLSEISYAYIDTISEQVMAEYQQERERWLSERSTVRADLLERLIGGDQVGVESAERSLGHRLRQRHLGLVLWSADPSAHGADLSVLEQVAVRLARLLDPDAAPLFWPKDRHTAWAWLSVGRGNAVVDSGEWRTALDRIDPQVRVAMGRAAPGMEGFRVTHLEALSAQQVALVAGGRAPRVTSFCEPDVRAVSLLAGDLEQTRRLVTTALGDLAVDTEQSERLRRTVQVFLAEKGSYLATAERLHLHKNTVKYRVDKAMSGRGRPISDDRFDLELALMACDRLGAAVLTGDGERSGASELRRRGVDRSEQQRH